MTRAHGHATPASITASSRPSSARRCYTRDRRAGDAGAEGEAREAVAGGASRRRCSRASRSRRKLTRAPGNDAADRRAQGRRPRAAGSRRARRAPRISTSCTPRASGTSGICELIVDEARRSCGWRSRRRPKVESPVYGVRKFANHPEVIASYGLRSPARHARRTAKRQLEGAAPCR